MTAIEDALMHENKNLCKALADVVAERDKLRADAERYRLLRNGQGWPAVFGASSAPEPLRGFMLDEAVGIAQRAEMKANAAFSGPRPTNDQESDSVSRGSAETHS